MGLARRNITGLPDSGQMGARSQALDRENSELRAILRSREIELRECNHRVANSLQLAASLLHMQTGKVSDNSTKSILCAAADRIQAIARFHRHLATINSTLRLDFSQCLKAIAAEIAKSSDMDCNVQSTPGLFMDGHVAINLSLIVNELLLNAKKHAYHSKPGGRLEIICLAGDDGNLHLSVIDHGPGLPPNFSLDKTTGLGMSVVRSIISQLQGNIVTENNQGACFKITVPIAATALAVQ